MTPGVDEDSVTVRFDLNEHGFGGIDFVPLPECDSAIGSISLES